MVRVVAERLRQDGVKVWFDEWVLMPGDSIPAKIEEGLERSRVLVLCMSANAFGSDWAQLESGTFRFRDPLNKERRFLPLRLDDALIKGSLGQFLYLDFRSRDNAVLQKLSELCRSKLSGLEIIELTAPQTPSAQGGHKIMKVLALFANPKGTNTLRLGEEDKTLQECIRRSKNRDHIELILRHAVTVDDIRRALLDDSFEVVHFSGHGTGTGLAFEDVSGRLFVPPQDAIAELLASFSPPLQCVVLNACYSLEQGTFASLGVPFTVAMEGPIADDAAIVFSGGFYDSLAAGKDVEFSFKQGVLALRLAKHPDSSAPRLIRKGESIPVEKAHREPQARSREMTELAQPVLVAVALDVSGSMEANINNRVGDAQSRLEAFQNALQDGTERSREFLNSVERMDTPVRVFSYAFGLRMGDVCDLFSMMKAADGVISPEEIETLKQRYTAEVTRRYSSSSLGGYESLARDLLGSGAVDSLIAGARANAEKEVRERILSHVQGRLSSRLTEIGDTTITLNELVKLWKGSRQSFADAEGMIFGATPMCRALEAIRERFTRELVCCGRDKPATVLLLVSDGESTDGDPIQLAQQVKDMGVTVIGCYITDHDVLEPRHLLNSVGQTWPKGAKDMFEMASELPANSVFARHLLREGWRLSDRAKAFVQVNHSEVLRELVSLALSPIEAGSQLLPKGR